MDEYLTQEEAAEFMRVTVQTLINWRRDKGLKFYKVGSYIRFKRQDLIDFIQQGESQNEKKPIPN